MPKVIHLSIRFVPDLFVLNIACADKNTSPDICIKFHKKASNQEKNNIFFISTLDKPPNDAILSACSKQNTHCGVEQW